jgi:hypothetical protein
MMAAMETMTGLAIEVTLVLHDRNGARGPWLIATASTKPGAGVGAVRLGYAQLKCATTDYASLDTAAFRLLYLLDGNIAEQELERVSKKSVASTTPD